MTHASPDRDKLQVLRVLDDDTRALVRLAAVIASGTDVDVRAAMAALPSSVPARWVEELLLQTYLFVGFPRALNATREWRRGHPTLARAGGELDDGEAWHARGEATCARVYGPMYARLRENVRQLHPLLDEWMITEGYGKVLSRSGLDLPRRELCIVAACAATAQERQLHSHLHGALNAGASPAAIGAALDALSDVVAPDTLDGARLLWARVRGK